MDRLDDEMRPLARCERPLERLDHAERVLPGERRVEVEHEQEPESVRQAQIGLLQYRRAERSSAAGSVTTGIGETRARFCGDVRAVDPDLVEVGERLSHVFGITSVSQAQTPMLKRLCKQPVAELRLERRQLGRVHADQVDVGGGLSGRAVELELRIRLALRAASWSDRAERSGSRWRCRRRRPEAPRSTASRPHPSPSVPLR